MLTYAASQLRTPRTPVILCSPPLTNIWINMLSAAHMKTSLLAGTLLLAVSCSPNPSTPPKTSETATAGTVMRLDPAFDAIVPRDAVIEKVAGGFTFIEGPLWRPSNVLWFSDVVGNVVRQWSPD